VKKLPGMDFRRFSKFRDALLEGWWDLQRTFQKKPTKDLVKMVEDFLKKVQELADTMDPQAETGMAAVLFFFIQPKKI